jgi:hypothetical protein
MISISITLLFLLSAYMGKRWFDAQQEVNLLRGQVAQLKRRLAAKD